MPGRTATACASLDLDPRLLPGGFCTLLLADLGAEVLKVEDTAGGDYIRWMPPYYGGEEEQRAGVASAYFLALNRNKRSLRLNLKDERGPRRPDAARGGLRRAGRELPPGRDGRLGVGYEDAARAQPAPDLLRDLGLRPGRPAAPLARATTPTTSRCNGLLGLTGRRGGPPIQSAGQIADLGGGGLMAAVGHPRRADRARALRRGPAGRHLDDRRLAFVARDGRRALLLPSSKVPQRGELELAGGILCYFPYEAKDGGWVSLGALEPKFWQNWCDGVGRPDLIEKQFEHPDSEAGARGRRRVSSERTRDEWARVRGRARLLPRADPRPRRGARLASSCARAGWSSSWTSPASAR